VPIVTTIRTQNVSHHIDKVPPIFPVSLGQLGEDADDMLDDACDEVELTGDKLSVVVGGPVAGGEVVRVITSGKVISRRIAGSKTISWLYFQCWIHRRVAGGEIFIVQEIRSEGEKITAALPRTCRDSDK
jgi:hypothetical protein